MSTVSGGCFLWQGSLCLFSWSDLPQTYVGRWGDFCPISLPNGKVPPLPPLHGTGSTGLRRKCQKASDFFSSKSLTAIQKVGLQSAFLTKNKFCHMFLLVVSGTQCIGSSALTVESHPRPSYSCNNWLLRLLWETDSGLLLPGATKSRA